MHLGILSAGIENGVVDLTLKVWPFFRLKKLHSTLLYAGQGLLQTCSCFVSIFLGILNCIKLAKNVIFRDFGHLFKTGSWHWVYKQIVGTFGYVWKWPQRDKFSGPLWPRKQPKFCNWPMAEDARHCFIILLSKEPFTIWTNQSSMLLFKSSNLC